MLVEIIGVISGLCIVCCFVWFFSLTMLIYEEKRDEEKNTKRRKSKDILVGILFVMVIIFAISLSIVIGDGIGTALAYFEEKVVYTTKSVVQEDTEIGAVLTARLTVGNKTRIYEIKLSRLSDWDGKTNLLAFRFRVVYDQVGKVYIIIPIK